jgi:hypothetical protein
MDAQTRARAQAASALRLAIGGRWRLASRVLDALYSAGPEGMVTAICTWADELIIRTPPVRRGEFTLSWKRAGTGQVTTDPMEVPDEVRWASAVLAARARGDTGALEALMRALPDDPAAIALHVTTLLQVVAQTLVHQHLPDRR